MNVRNRILEAILVLALTIIGFNLLIDCGVVEYYTNQIFQQILVIGIIYATLSRLLTYKKKYNLVIILGRIFFIGLCILLYHSNNMADFVAALICFYIDVEVMVGTKTLSERDEE